MRLSVFGIGYVGAVTAACFAEDGHNVICVDVIKEKVDQINEGVSPIIEEKIGDYIASNVKEGRLSATTDSQFAIENSDMAFICVGTPSNEHGALEYKYVESVLKEVGQALRDKNGHFAVVLRSTVLPGTFYNLVLPILEENSGKSAGENYSVLFHPEFLREGTSVYDFYNPPKIVVGENKKGEADKLLGLYDQKYDAPVIICDAHEAEMVKYSDNLFHALKITFANEIGQFCFANGVDSQKVMDIFCQDTKLNISSYYLRPGFAFGGSCLPKDLRAFLHGAKELNVNTPMLKGVLESNQHQIERVLFMILASAAHKIGFYGIAFKKGTDDLRESPYIEIAERLLGKGKELLFYDENVKTSKLIGKNKSQIEVKFPHLNNFMVEEVKNLFGCDLILICHKPEQAFLDELKIRQTRILDLTGYGLKDSGLIYDSIV